MTRAGERLIAAAGKERDRLAAEAAKRRKALDDMAALDQERGLA